MGLFERQPGQAGGISPIIIAIMMVIMGLFAYYTHTEKNPITGIPQHISITPQQEIKLGMQAAPKMAAQMGGEISVSDLRAQEVRKIGSEIASKTIASKGPWHFQYHLLADEKTINAFALPGGQIFITLGLYNALKTEAQLAGVLAHETGHVIQRHSAQQMSKGELGKIFVMATGVGVSDPQHPARGQMAMAASSLINHITQLHYSRKDELEADLWGLKLMSELGYDPKAMLEVLQILQEKSPSGHKPEMLLTHPYPQHRITAIEHYLKEHAIQSNFTKGKDLHN